MSNVSTNQGNKAPVAKASGRTWLGLPKGWFSPAKSDYRVHLDGKAVQISLTSRAARVLSQRSLPIYVELELYFSCMLVKHVNFREKPAAAESPVEVTRNLFVYFRPVMRENCEFEKILATPKTDMPVADGKRFVPKRVEIDYKSGNWTGQYFTA
jgi:hypothetical protein